RRAYIASVTGAAKRRSRLSGEALRGAANEARRRSPDVETRAAPPNGKSRPRHLRFFAEKPGSYARAEENDRRRKELKQGEHERQAVKTKPGEIEIAVHRC